VPSETSRARWAAIAVGAAAASWGLWSLFLRPAELPSATAGTIVFAVMAVVAAPRAWRSPAVSWTRSTVMLLIANAALDAANLLAFFGAMQRTSVAIAVLTHYLAPLVIALSAPWIDRQRVPGAVPAAIVAVAGLTLVLEPWAGHGAPLGAIFGALSAFAYAGNVFVVRRLGLRIGAARVISYHSALAALLMLPFAVAAGGRVSIGSAAGLALGAITIGAIAGAAFVWGVGIIGSARAAMLTYLEPLVAVAIGAAWWREPIGHYALLGAVLVIASGIYVARAGSQNV
jgi:drug/metabolite transporter, DME family